MGVTNIGHVCFVVIVALKKVNPLYISLTFLIQMLSDKLKNYKISISDEGIKSEVTNQIYITTKLLDGPLATFFDFKYIFSAILLGPFQLLLGIYGMFNALILLLKSNNELNPLKHADEIYKALDNSLIPISRKMPEEKLKFIALVFNFIDFKENMDTLRKDTSIKEIRERIEFLENHWDTLHPNQSSY